MSVAIELFGAVYTTQGGMRYHADPACYALANGRSTQAYRAGEGLYGESWYGAQSLDGLYPLVRRSTISAAHRSYTACLRCVPSEQAMQPLPLVTFDYGHEPTIGISENSLADTVCQRCTEPGFWWGNVSELRPVHIVWPCMSAVVLGLVPRGGA
jgi:hypothetical protein